MVEKQRMSEADRRGGAGLNQANGAGGGGGGGGQRRTFPDTREKPMRPPKRGLVLKAIVEDLSRSLSSPPAS